MLGEVQCQTDIEIKEFTCREPAYCPEEIVSSTQDSRNVFTNLSQIQNSKIESEN